MLILDRERDRVRVELVDVRLIRFGLFCMLCCFGMAMVVICGVLFSSGLRARYARPRQYPDMRY